VALVTGHFYMLYAHSPDGYVAAALVEFALCEQIFFGF